MSKRIYTHFLEDILNSMLRIQEYLVDMTYEKFEQDQKTIDAVIRNFEIIGEATKKIPESVRFKYSYIPWEEMYRLRNRISHEYFGIDLQIIWDIANNELPENIFAIEEIVRSEKLTNKNTQ